MYKINYGAGIQFESSVAIEYGIKLEVNDGSGWTSYPFSEAVDSVLNGSGNSNVQANRTVTMTVDRGTPIKLRMQEKISDDTYLVDAGAGGFIVIERIDNGIKL